MRFFNPDIATGILQVVTRANLGQRADEERGIPDAAIVQSVPFESADVYEVLAQLHLSALVTSDSAPRRIHGKHMTAVLHSQIAGRATATLVRIDGKPLPEHKVTVDAETSGAAALKALIECLRSLTQDYPYSNAGLLGVALTGTLSDIRASRDLNLRTRLQLALGYDAVPTGVDTSESVRKLRFQGVAPAEFEPMTAPVLERVHGQIPNGFVSDPGQQLREAIQSLQHAMSAETWRDFGPTKALRHESWLSARRRPTSQPDGRGSQRPGARSVLAGPVYEGDARPR